MMLFIHQQYARSSRQLAVDPKLVVRPPQREERIVIPIPGLNRAVVQAVNVARSIGNDVRAVYITDDASEASHLRAEFERQIPGVPLVIVESPYRALVGPFLAYLDVLDAAWPPDKEEPITFVVIPEYVARSWWERLLYNQASRRLRTTLLGRPHTVVVAVPYRREEPAMFEGVLPPAGTPSGPPGPLPPVAPAAGPGPVPPSGSPRSGPPATPNATPDATPPTLGDDEQHEGSYPGT